MIYVDQRKGSIELLPHLHRLNARAEASSLEFGDICFEGKGPQGSMAIGIERKTLHDMLNCIEDARFSAHQMPGMKSLYHISILLLEGHWKPHDPDGFLMEGFNGGVSWGYCKNRSQRTMYSKLYRYLMSVQLSGFFVTYSRDLAHSAINVLEWYHYFQKKWEDHTSMLETQKILVPSLFSKPPLVKKWANDIEGVGVKTGELAAARFKTPIALATADELEWLRIPGIGVATARDIYRQVNGLKR